MSETARHTPALNVPAADDAFRTRRRESDPLAPMQGLLVALLLSAGLWALIAWAFSALR